MKTKLTNNELTAVGGGNFWKDVGQKVGELNQYLDKKITQVSQKTKEAWDDFKQGREEARKEPEQQPEPTPKAEI